MTSRSRTRTRTADSTGRARELFATLIALTLAVAPAAAQEADGADPSIGAIRFYQEHLSSLRHSRCRFSPSCSEYAAQAIARYGLAEGSARAADRLMRCNASAAGAYPREANGQLADPVDAAASPTGARVPAWLLPPPQADLPPLPETLDAGRRERVNETSEFALQLEREGDAAQASTEFERAGSVAGSAEARYWSFARSGECQLAAARWPEAQRAFVTAGMLAPSPAEAGRSAFLVAASAFDAGAFTSCERLLVVPSLSPPDSTPAPTIVGAERVATLRGLAAMGLGDWTRASSELAGAGASATDERSAARARLLAAYAGEGPGLSRRSAGLAQSLSALVPGAGQAYAGQPRDGFRHLVFNAALIATVVSFARNDMIPAAYVTAAFALPFYVGNIIGAGETSRRHNRRERLALLDRALKESAR